MVPSYCTLKVSAVRGGARAVREEWADSGAHERLQRRSSLQTPAGTGGEVTFLQYMSGDLSCINVFPFHWLLERPGRRKRLSVSFAS